MRKVIKNDDNILKMIGAAVSFVALTIVIVSVHEAYAKQCNSNGDNDNNDQNNNSNDDSKTCINRQVLNDNSPKTPFVLSMPFP